MGLGGRLEAPHIYVAPRPAPRVAPRPAPVVHTSLPSGSLTQDPFAGAQREAARRVEVARRRIAPAPKPYIPRLANPTPEQTQAALAIARRAQERAVGPKPSMARVREYHEELKNDPRNREYVQTLIHYAQAAARQHAEEVGRVIAGGGVNAASARTAAGRALSRAAAIKLGEGVMQRAAVAQASPAPAPHGISLPVLGTIVPGSTLQKAELAASSAIPNEAAKLAQIRGLGGAVSELATGAPAKGLEGRGSFIDNTVADLARLPANTIASVAQLGSAGAQAIGGNTRPLGQIGSSLLHQVEHPVQTFKEHPISTALMFSGMEEAAGKALGSVARSGALGDAARSAASTARQDLKLYNDMAVSRRYSSDPLRKALQVAAERARAKAPGALQQAPDQAAGVGLRRAVKGGTVKSGEVDVAVDTGEQLRRRLRGETTKAIGSVMPKRGADAVPLIVEGVVRSPQTLEADLAKERARLLEAQTGGKRVVVRHGNGITGIQRAGEPLTGKELAANKANVARIDAMLHDKAFLAHPDEAFHAAAHYIATTAPLTEALQRVGHLEPEQLRAALFPYAQAHMGARYFSVADHAVAEAGAKQAERAAFAKLEHLQPGTPEYQAAYREAQAARVQRAAVSGRGPVGQVLERENRMAQVRSARTRLTKAQNDLKKVEHARSRLVGAQRALRASHGMREATEGERALLRTHDSHLAAARAELHRAQDAWVQARDAAQAAKLPKARAGLRKANGEYLPTSEIEAHARANGVVGVGFVSHEEQLTGRGSFFKSTTRRPALASKQRTGVSFEKGIYHRGYDALVAQGSRLANDYAAHHATDQRLGRFGVGSFASKEHALAEAENFSHTPEGERIVHSLGPLKPVPIGPERVRVQRNVEPGAVDTAREQFGVQPHRDVPEAAQPEGKYTLLPQMVAERLAEHDALLGGTAGKKLFQKGTNQWRQTMLFTSPRWLLGNPQEQAIRLVFGGAAPKFLGGRSGRFAARLVDAYDKIGRENTPEAAAAREALASLVRGSHYSAAEQLAIVRKADQFAGSTLLGPTLGAAEHSSEAGALRAVVKPWRAWRDVVGKGMAKLERESRSASLGKVAIRDIHSFTGKWRNVMRMTDQTVEDYARGTLTQAKTGQLVREVDEMMGAWGHLSPTVRSAVQTWSPFGLWWLTSMRFLRRLPIQYPVKTAITAAIYNATQHIREEHPAEAPWEVGGIHVHLPLGLGGAVLQPTYYSPAGVGIEPGVTAADMVLPQVAEPLSELRGRDLLTGEKLTAPGKTRSGQPPNAVQTAGIVLNTLAQGLIPGYRQVQQVREQGGKAYSTSNPISPQVKPGSQRSLEQTLFKIASPVRFYWTKNGARGTGSGASAPATLRDSIRQGLREQAGQRASSPLREAIREEQRREALVRAR